MALAAVGTQGQECSALASASALYVIDPAIATAVLGLDVDLVMRNGDLLGRLLDTFVLAQLRAELARTNARPHLYHVRQREGRLEIDLLAELGGGRLVGLESRLTRPPEARECAASRCAPGSSP